MRIHAVSTALVCHPVTRMGGGLDPATLQRELIAAHVECRQW